MTPSTMIAAAMTSTRSIDCANPSRNGWASRGSSALMNDESLIDALDPRLAQPILDGFAQSIDLVLVIAAAIMVLGVILTAILPELPLRNVSGIQGRIDNEAEAAAQKA